MVYVLQVERLEREVLAERQVTATLVAAGAKVPEPPTVAQAVERFDADLLAEPVRLKTVDAEQLQLRRALGVA